MWKKRRHNFITNLARPFLNTFCKIKYNATHDKPISCKDGALIISNHTTSMDQFYMGMLFKEQLYYMISADVLMHRFLGKFLKWLINPITKEKGKSGDVQAIKNCMRVAKENGNICIFIEGNRTLSGKLCNVDYSIVKLAKALGKPLIICNIEGGYGTDPRWGRKIRRGRLHSSIKKIYSYDEIKNMDNDELYKIIIDGITVDDYNYYHKYKGKKRAEYLERILYICPICGHMHTISSKGNFVICKNCGLKVEYQESLRLKANNEIFKFETISDWYDYQLEVVGNKEYNDDAIYSDPIYVYTPRLYKSKKYIGEGVMTLYKDRLVFEMKKNKLELCFDEIDGMTLVGKKKLNIYVGNTTYQVFKDKKINTLKYMHLFYILKARRAGKECDFIGI